MDRVDQVPIRVLHVLEADISQDTGIVDENIDATECLDSGLDDPIAVLDGIVVGDGLAASGLDLVDNYISSLDGQPESHGSRIEVMLTLVELPSPLSPFNEPPRSLTTTLAPRDPKKVA